MSANYWTSSHLKDYIYTKSELNVIRLELFKQEYTKYGNNWLTIPLQIKDENNGVTQNKQISIYAKELHYDRDYNLRIYLYLQLMKLGKKFQLKQVIISTAMVYLQRFLLKCSIKECNVYYLITTCLYLASKVEECPIHIKSLNLIAKSFWPEFIHSDFTKITEFEFYLIEELSSYMIVYHPYDPLKKILENYTIFAKDTIEDGQNIDDYLLNYEFLQDSWAIINDSYVTDSHLLYHPHIIAISSLLLALVLKYTKMQKKFDKFKEKENRKKDMLQKATNNSASKLNNTNSSNANLNNAYPGMNFLSGGSTNSASNPGSGGSLLNNNGISLNNTTSGNTNEDNDLMLIDDDMMLNLNFGMTNNATNTNNNTNAVNTHLTANTPIALEKNHLDLEKEEEDMKQAIEDMRLMSCKTKKMNEYIAFSLINIEQIEGCMKELMVLYQFWTGSNKQDQKFNEKLQKNKYNEEWIRFLLYQLYYHKSGTAV
ncbi:hypothetical protein ACO0SA_001374 [Hanseniaspora valbyensis]